MGTDASRSRLDPISWQAGRMRVRIESILDQLMQKWQLVLHGYLLETLAALVAPTINICR